MCVTEEKDDCLGIMLKWTLSRKWEDVPQLDVGEKAMSMGDTQLTGG